MLFWNKVLIIYFKLEGTIMKKKTILILVTALCFLFSGCVRIDVYDEDTGEKIPNIPVTGVNSNGDILGTLTTDSSGKIINYDYEYLQDIEDTYSLSVPAGTYNGINYDGASEISSHSGEQDFFLASIYLKRTTPLTLTGDDIITLNEGYLNVSYSYQTNSDTPVTFSLSDTLNNHLSIDSSGTLSLKSGLSGGEYSFSITAANDSETATKNVLLKIVAAPSIAGNSEIKLLKGYAAFTEKYTLVNPETINLSDDLNGFLTINSEGLLTIAKGLNNGIYQTTIILDNEGVKATLDLTIKVNEAPTIMGDDKIDLLLGYKEITKSYSVNAFPNPQFLATALSDSELLQAMMPEGGEVVDGKIDLTIVEGLPLGTYKIELNATNGIEPDAKKIITITVSEVKEDNSNTDSNTDNIIGNNDQHNADTNSNPTNTAKNTAVNTGDLVNQKYILLLTTIFLLSLALVIKRKHL